MVGIDELCAVVFPAAPVVFDLDVIFTPAGLSTLLTMSCLEKPCAGLFSLIFLGMILLVLGLSENMLQELKSILQQLLRLLRFDLPYSSISLLLFKFGK